MKWRLIKTAPKDGTHILVYDPISGTRVVVYWRPFWVKYEDRGGWYMAQAFNNEWHPSRPSHWQKLSKIPLDPQQKTP